MRKRVKLHLIQPGKPTQNAYIESFSGKFRDECLDKHIFLSLEDARRKIEAWREDYKADRPHHSLNNMTPNEFSTSLSDEITKLKVVQLVG
jgi:putative transposase